jgi:hypothetical protein
MSKCHIPENSYLQYVTCPWGMLSQRRYVVLLEIPTVSILFCLENGDSNNLQNASNTTYCKKQSSRNSIKNKEVYLLGYNTVQYSQSQLKFSRNNMPLFRAEE